jgi:hypothetical protein
MPRSVHVGFVVDKVALGQVFSEFFSFPLALHAHVIYLGDEQAHWWTQFRDVVSPH